MRIVKWSAEERVDVPDITAMSYLILGEFRRTMRLVTGDATFVVKGFKVEPEFVPSNRVLIKLLNGAGDYSEAIGAETLSAGIDYGQIIGDRDSSFLTEGVAQQLLDFTGQPNGSYTVEMKFTYTDNTDDNRAFWNPGTATEGTQLTPTRTVSGWQARYVPGGPTGGEWIPLATVAWASVAITGGDITDLRNFLWEGGDAAFQATSQTGTGGVEDFDRSTDRRANGLLRLRTLVRALQRQISDIKGPSDDGHWDWFSRVFKPTDPNGTIPTGQTKNLRSIDTLTLTVGDGVTEWGDFNGATGVNDALAHIAAITPSTSMPEAVEIVIKGSAVTYTITGEKTIVTNSTRPFTLTLRGARHNPSVVSTVEGRPLITCDFATLSASTYMVTVSGGSGQNNNIKLENINVVCSGNASGKGMFSANGYIDARRCLLEMSATTIDAGASYVLRASKASKVFVSHCNIIGPVQFYDVGAAGNRVDQTETGVMENCVLTETRVRLRFDSALGGTTPDAVNGFEIRNCALTGRSSTVYTGSTALIDGGSGVNLHITKCVLNYGFNEHGVYGYTYNGFVPNGWKIKDTTFLGTSSNGTHGVGAGTGGATGTGWAIQIGPSAGGTLVDDLSITDCKFNVSSIDAGGVYLINALSPRIRGLQFKNCGHTNTASASFTGIQLDGNSTYFAHSVIKGCAFSAFTASGAGNDNVICINTTNHIWSSLIEGCHFEGTGLAALPAGVNSVQVAGKLTKVKGCTWVTWSTSTGGTNCAGLGLRSAMDGSVVEGCSFSNVVAYAIGTTGLGSGPSVVVKGCTVITSVANVLGVDVRGLPDCVVGDCSFQLNTNGDFAIIVDQAGFVVMGNRSAKGDFKNVGAVAGRGYNEAGQDLNLMHAYV